MRAAPLTSRRSLSCSTSSRTSPEKRKSTGEGRKRAGGREKRERETMASQKERPKHVATWRATRQTYRNPCRRTQHPRGSSWTSRRSCPDLRFRPTSRRRRTSLSCSPRWKCCQPRGESPAISSPSPRGLFPPFFCCSSRPTARTRESTPRRASFCAGVWGRAGWGTAIVARPLTSCVHGLRARAREAKPRQGFFSLFLLPFSPSK